jgi:hypothetical protein
MIIMDVTCASKPPLKVSHFAAGVNQEMEMNASQTATRSGPSSHDVWG